MKIHAAMLRGLADPAVKKRLNDDGAETTPNATPEEFGGGWDYNYDEVLWGGKGRSVFLEKVAGSKTWGPNWDEDEGGGECDQAHDEVLPIVG